MHSEEISAAARQGLVDALAPVLKGRRVPRELADEAADILRAWSEDPRGAVRRAVALGVTIGAWMTECRIRSRIRSIRSALSSAPGHRRVVASTESLDLRPARPPAIPGEGEQK